MDLPSDLEKRITEKSWQLELPSASEKVGRGYTPVALTVEELRGYVRGASSPSVDVTIRFDTAYNAVGTEIVTGGSTIDSETTGTVVTSFDVAVIPAGSVFWLETTATVGTVQELLVTMRVRG